MAHRCDCVLDVCHVMDWLPVLGVPLSHPSFPHFECRLGKYTGIYIASSVNSGLWLTADIREYV